MIKFIELYDKIPFPDAVRQLAARVGVPVPEAEESREEAANQREREALLKTHEVAAAFFREQLEAPGGAAARRLLDERRLTAETVALLGIGYAPRTGQQLHARLTREGFEAAVQQKSGLVSSATTGRWWTGSVAGS